MTPRKPDYAGWLMLIGALLLGVVVSSIISGYLTEIGRYWAR